MAISIDLIETNGAAAIEDPIVTTGQGNLNITRALKFGRADDTDPNPIVRPVRGLKKSFEKYVHCQLSGIDAGERLSNLQLFTSGPQYSSGVSVEVGLTQAYEAPLSTDSAVADTSIFLKTPDSPLLLTPEDQEYSSDGNNGSEILAIGDRIGDFMVLQMSVSPTAKPGMIVTNYTPVSLVFRYDEA
tara:strand:- start:185 stop:745 length:561 start_codon:yes stop_codon:yes gene_type:complete